jgi:CBS domain-containing protein
MSIGKICHRPVATISSEATVAEAAKLMREHHIGDVIVLGQHTHHANPQPTERPVGILTDRDITVATIALSIPVEGMRVSDILLPTLVTAYESESIFVAIERMKENGIRRLPIVNEREELVGIVTADDLLSLLADELKSLSAIKDTQKHREETTRRRFA